MADTEMQELDVAFGAEAVLVDTKFLEEEPQETENYQNPSEIPQPLLLGDKTFTLESDVHLTNGDGQVNGHGINGDVGVADHSEQKTHKVQIMSPKSDDENAKKRKSWLLSDSEALGIDEAGTPEEQATFLRELETFHKENFLDFKAPKFYGQPLNTLKLWRAVVKLGGYDVVTTSKLWRQVGESFHPPKTCTTVSYTFRNFYEKALLEYEKYLRKNGELNLLGSPFILPSNSEKEACSHQGSGSGRARRDSAARAMQGWHAKRLVGSGEFTAPTVKSPESYFFQDHREFFISGKNLISGLGAIARRMLKIRGRGCCFLCCLIVFVFAVPCYSHETLFDGKTLNVGKELWKETLPLQSGSRVYKLEGLKSNSWYEVKISYPASIPALFTLQLLKNGVVGFKLNQMRRLLNTEKLIFKTESLDEVNNKDGLYVLVTVEPEGIVAIPNIKERSFIIYNIVCEEQLLGIPYSSWSVVVLVVLCLVAALILPRFLPSYLLIKDGDRDRDR